MRRTVDTPPSLARAVGHLVPASLAATVGMIGARLATVDAPSAVSAVAVMAAGGIAFIGVAYMTGISEVRTLLRR